MSVAGDVADLDKKETQVEEKQSAELELDKLGLEGETASKSPKQCLSQE